MPFVAIPEAVEEIRAGRILVVVDEEDTTRDEDHKRYCLFDHVISLSS